jgi:hypothetical protein
MLSSHASHVVLVICKAASNIIQIISVLSCLSLKGRLYFEVYSLMQY